MRLTTTLAVISFLAPSVFANHGPGTSGGGNFTMSGETLRQGGFDLTLRTDITKFESVSRAEAEQKAIAHGVTDDIQLSAYVGYYWGNDFIDAEEDGGGGAESATADPKGLTDTWIQGKWRMMHGPHGHLALVGGVKLPTGKDDEKLSNGE